MKVIKKPQCNICIINIADGYSVYKSNISCISCHEKAKTHLLNSYITEYNDEKKKNFINHMISCNDRKCRKYKKLCYLFRGLINDNLKKKNNNGKLKSIHKSYIDSIKKGTTLLLSLRNK